MPDISMCVGGNCTLKKDCYRYRAIPGMLQAYFMNPPIEEDKCDYYWPLNKGYTKIRSMEEIKHGPLD